MIWDWRSIKAIMRKDLSQVLQNRMVWLPMIVVPIVILVVLPLVMILLPILLGAEAIDMDELAPMIDAIPESMRQDIAGLDLEQLWIVFSANYMFSPMFLIVPLMVSSIIGSDSFVGEKERRTLEGLLYTPISDGTLFVAKLLGALAPALVVNVASFLLYGIVVNAAGYSVVGRIFFPTPSWWALVFWLGPAIATAGLGAVVLVSSKTKTLVQAQQISGMLVLPVVFLMIAQVSGLFFLSPAVVFLVGIVVWLAGGWFIWIGAKTFSRDALISRV